MSPRPDLLTLIPSGASFALVLRPRELLADAALGVIARDLLDGAPDRQLTRALGGPFGAIDRLVYASYDPGSLAVYEGSLDAQAIVRGFEERMAPVEVSADVPYPRRAGFVGNERREVLALATDRLAIGAGHGEPMLGLLARQARYAPTGAGPERAAEPSSDLGVRGAFDDSEVSRLLVAHGDAPVLLVALRPVPLPVDTGAGLLLAQHRAIAVSARPLGEGERVVVRLSIVGRFPPGAEEGFRRLAADLAGSDLGDLLGMRTALGALEVHADENRVEITQDFSRDSLRRGLRALLVADLSEITSGPDARP